MTNHYATIRAGILCQNADIGSIEKALSALAELEKAASEPVATVCLITDRFAHNHCIEAQLQIDPGAQLPIGTKLYAAPPVPAVAVSDAMCERAFEQYALSPARISRAEIGRDMIAAVQAELGPALGLFSREEMAAQVEAAYREGWSDYDSFEKPLGAQTDRDWLESNARKRLEVREVMGGGK